MQPLRRLVRGSRLGYTPSSQVRTAYRGPLSRRGGWPAGRASAPGTAMSRLPRPAPRLLALVPLLAVLVTTACASAPATSTTAPSQSASAAAPGAVATGASSAPASTSAVRRLDPPVSVAAGHVNIFADIGLYVAAAKGYFKEEGLDVSLEGFRNTGSRSRP